MPSLLGHRPQGFFSQCPLSYMTHLGWEESLEPWWCISTSFRLPLRFASELSQPWWVGRVVGEQARCCPLHLVISLFCPAASQGSQGPTHIPVRSASFPVVLSQVQHTMKQGFFFFFPFPFSFSPGALQLLSPEFVSALLLGT